jgi:hypothetical protein
MKIGSVVRVEVYGGEIVQRVVCNIIDNKILVCSQEEIDKSLAENREPRPVGYDREKVFLA